MHVPKDFLVDTWSSALLHVHIFQLFVALWRHLKSFVQALIAVLTAPYHS